MSSGKLGGEGAYWNDFAIMSIIEPWSNWTDSLVNYGFFSAPVLHVWKKTSCSFICDIFSLSALSRLYLSIQTCSLFFWHVKTTVSCYSFLTPICFFSYKIGDISAVTLYDHRRKNCFLRMKNYSQN